jgi:DNA-binding XRE family transcriptional regulator
VSKQTITMTELGRQDPSVTIALRIARVLETTVEALFGEDIYDGGAR